ncbi:MAG: CHAT domain-containing protein [Anaerolineales bacterium]|nr:CHAT domain-containing protein [Anaerolineales bacterium]
MAVRESELDDYLETAAALFDGRLAEAELPPAVANLPAIDQQRVEQLAAMAAEAAFTQPKYGWALTAVAAVAADCIEDTFLQALAAWYLARAANAWVQPDRVQTAVTRARAAFAALDLPGWLAACDWQANAEPWLRNDFHQAIAELGQACITLQQHGMVAFSWQCRLSLAYGHILVGQFELAEEQLDRCEQAFVHDEDSYHLVICHLHRSSSYRRQKLYPAAITSLHKASEVLKVQSNPILLAKLNAQLAYCEFLYNSDHWAAERLFMTAAAQFDACEVELWHAFCLNGLVQLFNNTGRLTEANQLLLRLKTIYDCYAVLGLQADHAIECGAQALFRGDWSRAVTFFQVAETKFKQLNIPYLSAMSNLYTGDAYWQANNYLRALSAYENALRKFEKLQNEWRIAECKVRLSKVWIDLQRPFLAQHYLQEAAVFFEDVGQLDWLLIILRYQARIFIQNNEQSKVASAFKRALETAETIGNPAQIARTKRLFGEALCLIGAKDRVQSEKLLEAAAATFTEIGMLVEEAICHVALGYQYHQTTRLDAAQTAWEQALTLSKAALPDIAWRAYGGLGLLAEERQQNRLALVMYARAAGALVRMRHDLWQPALAGSYLSQPAVMLARAVTLAGKMGAAPHAVTFIEAGKAQHNLDAGSPGGQTTPQSIQLVELGAEIRWLQEQILDVKEADAVGVRQMRALNQRLVQKARSYDLLAGQVERAQFGWQEQKEAKNGSEEQAIDFDGDRLRDWANRRLKHPWLALNYYLTDSHLIGTALTPEREFVWRHALTPAVHFALNLLTQKPTTLAWPRQHLITLGDWLLPGYIQAQLTPATYLLLAPHRQLHRLPWAALLVGTPRHHLATTALPVIVPSWGSLMALWGQAAPTAGAHKSGLVMAVADFKGRYPFLEQAAGELEALQDLYAGALTVLRDVTTAQLEAFACETRLARFDFMHIVSHAFVDQLTGRLSGVALHDRDLWLDEVPPLGPLPATVVLSACSSNVGRLFAGDEQVGLAATCLTAGAQRVVGSLWPVADKNMPRLMGAFYRYLRAGRPAAGALAEAQREMLAANLPAEVWSGFTLVGAP